RADLDDHRDLDQRHDDEEGDEESHLSRWYRRRNAPKPRRGRASGLQRERRLRSPLTVVGRRKLVGATQVVDLVELALEHPPPRAGQLVEVATRGRERAIELVHLVDERLPLL